MVVEFNPFLWLPYRIRTNEAKVVASIRVALMNHDTRQQILCRLLVYRLRTY